VYGDTYAGYAELAVLPLSGNPWSHGPLAVPDSLPLARAVFVEPLADCLHAIHDQGRVRSGDAVTVVGAGQMGLQMVACAAAAGANVTAVEPDDARRALALEFGAAAAVSALAPAADADLVVLTIPVADLVGACVEACAPGGRVVLFAGFGDRPDATLDLNRIHYREITVVGSEWIGTPPNVRPERYAQAGAMLAGGLELERLVTRTVGLDGIAAAFTGMRERSIMKAVLVP
jgi:L-iditol 2-dehydrogenase